MSGTHLLAHRHGGAPEEREGLLDFSVNVSPLPLPLPELSFPFFDPGAYPSVEGRGIREFYAGRFGIDERCILPLNGAIEGIYLLPRALGLKRVLIPQPSFFDYGRACRLAGAEVSRLWLSAGDGFAFPDIESTAAALEGCDALFAANPNNPTGTMLPKEQLLALACRFPDKQFIVDEAFIQFTDGFPGNSLMFGTEAFRNIVVVHSLTKFYAVPGLRLGAIVSHPDTVGKLYGHKEPWTVNAVAESVARHLAGCGDYERELLELVKTGRSLLSRMLGDASAVRLYGGSANFFLASLPEGAAPGTAFSALAERGVFVRECANFEGLGPAWFRFAIRSVEENLRLVAALGGLFPLRQGAGR